MSEDTKQFGDVVRKALGEVTFQPPLPVIPDPPTPPAGKSWKFETKGVDYIRVYLNDQLTRSVYVGPTNGVELTAEQMRSAVYAAMTGLVADEARQRTIRGLVEDMKKTTDTRPQQFMTANQRGMDRNQFIMDELMRAQRRRRM